jgi:hypothetical protein
MRDKSGCSRHPCAHRSSVHGLTEEARERPEVEGGLIPVVTASASPWMRRRERRKDFRPQGKTKSNVLAIVQDIIIVHDAAEQIVGDGAVAERRDRLVPRLSGPLSKPVTCHNID